MDKKGTSTFHLLTMHTDFLGNLSLDRIVDYLIQAASQHAFSLGFGATAMRNRNTAWVLSRMSIEINRYPRPSDVLKVETWISSQGNLFTNRNFRIRDQQGHVLVEAISMWAVLNLNTRKPLRLSDFFDQDYTLIMDNFSVDPPKNISLPDSFNQKTSRKVLYSDLDINNHLNSIRCISWLLDLFSTSQFQSHHLKSFMINYLSESYFNDEIVIKHQENELESIVELFNQSQDRVSCKARIVWE